MRRLLAWAPAVAWAGLIFWFSAQPNLRFASQESLDFVIRKSGHMFVFGVLAVLLWNALMTGGVRRARQLAWVFAVLYAASDEFHQGFTAGRHPSPIDVGIDAVGAFVGLTALSLALMVARERGRRRALLSPAARPRPRP